MWTNLTRKTVHIMTETNKLVQIGIQIQSNVSNSLWNEPSQRLLCHTLHFLNSLGNIGDAWGSPSLNEGINYTHKFLWTWRISIRINFELNVVFEGNYGSKYRVKRYILSVYCAFFRGLHPKPIFWRKHTTSFPPTKCWI